MSTFTSTGQLESLAAKGKSGLNLSLLKAGPITHVVIGAGLAVLVLVAAVLGIAIVVDRAGYSAPICVNDTAITYKTDATNIYVLQNDINPRGGSMTIVSVAQIPPEYGTLQIIKAQPGTTSQDYLLYTPANIGNYTSHFAGNFTFSYIVSNDKLSSQGSVTVTVLDHAPQPVVLNIVLTKNSQHNVIDVFTLKDSQGYHTVDIDDDIIYVSKVLNAPQYVTEYIGADNQSLIFNTNQQAQGTGTLLYNITDLNITVTATLVYTVADTPPIALPDFFTNHMNTIASNLPVLQNDTDPDGDPIYLVSLVKTMGLAFITGGGQTVTIYPVMGPYYDNVQYTVTDGELDAVSFIVVHFYNTPPTTGTMNIVVPKNSPGYLITNIPMADIDPYTTLNMSLPSATTYQGTAKPSSTETLITTAYLGGAIDSYIRYAVYNWSILYIPIPQQSYTTMIQYNVTDGYAWTLGQINIEVKVMPPIALPSSFDVLENVQQVLNLTGSYYDIDMDPVQLDSCQSPTQAGGTCQVTSGQNQQTVLYTPPTGFRGTDTFTYTVSQADLYASATITVNVEPGTPVAYPSNFTLYRGVSYELNVLSNDYEPSPGVSLTIDGLDATSAKSIPLSTDATQTKVSYNASNGAPYQDSFQYNNTNGYRSSNWARVSLNIINAAPVAVDDYVSVNWRTPVNIYVLVNATDINPGDRAYFSIVSPLTEQPSFGTATIQGGFYITYTPDKNHLGTNTFQYQVQDLYSVSNVATVYVDVTNSPPTVVDKTYSLFYRTQGRLLNVISGDFDPDGDPVFLAAVMQPSSGASVIQVGNSVSFSTTGVQLSPITFDIVVTDTVSNSTATITVDLTDSAPIASNYSVSILSTSSGYTFNVVQDASDSDTADLPYLTIGSYPTASTSLGSVSANMSQGTLVFVPNRQAGTETFSYTITDGALSGTGFITVNCLAVPPSSIPRQYTFTWYQGNAGVNITPSVSPPPAVTGSVNGYYAWLSGKVYTYPSDGNVVFDNAFILDQPGTAHTYSLNYTSNKYFVGTDNFIVGYELDDGSTGNFTISVTLTNTPAPVAVSETYTVNGTNPQSTFIIDVMKSNYDPDIPDAALYFKTVSYSGTGSIAYSTTVPFSNISYTPAPYFVGTNTIQYTITDGRMSSAPATITINVDNLPPIVVSPPTKTILWNVSSVTLNLAATASDPNSPPETPFTITVGAAASGATITNDGNGEFTYCTPANPPYNTISGVTYSYTDTFSYTVTNTYEMQSTGTVTIVIYNDQPTGNPSSYNFPEAYSHPPTYQLAVLSNDSDEDGDPISIQSVTYNGNGLVSHSATVVFYQPPADYVGSDSFTYVITDGHLKSSPISVSISLTSSPPTASPVTVTALKAVSYTWDILSMSHAYSSNGNPLSISLVTTLADCVKCQVLSVTSTGSITFQSLQNRSGPQVVEFIVKDAFGQTGSISLTINIENLPPIAVADSYIMFQNLGNLVLNENPRLNDTDADGDTLELISVNWVDGSSVGGTIEVSTAIYPHGGILFTKVASFISPPTLMFNYTISDMDLDNPMYSSVVSTIDVVQPSLFAGVATYNVYTQNQPFTTTTSSLLAYDTISDPSQTVVFLNISCGSGCQNGEVPTLSGSQITMNNPTDCSMSAFQYCVVASGDPEAVACGMAYVYYHYCTYCSAEVDIGFLIDSSSGANMVQWGEMISFIKEIINLEILGANQVNVAINQFSSTVQTVLYLTSDATQINAALNYLEATGPMGQNTNMIAALAAMNTTLAAGPQVTPLPIGQNIPPAPSGSNPNTNPRKAVTKTLFVLAYSAANEPCNCTGKVCDLGRPWKTTCTQCADCVFDPTNTQAPNFCSPCSSPLPLAYKINNQNPQNGFDATWRIFTIAIGTQNCYFDGLGNYEIMNICYNPLSCWYWMHWDHLYTHVQHYVNQLCQTADFQAWPSSDNTLLADFDCDHGGAFEDSYAYPPPYYN